MTFVSTLRQARGSARGSKKTLGSASRAAWQHPKGAFAVRRGPWRPVATVENLGFALAPTQKAAQSPLFCAFCCFPPASPALRSGAGKQKAAPKGRSMPLISLRKNWSGRRDSNPPPPPWHGCPRGPTHARVFGTPTGYDKRRIHRVSVDHHCHQQPSHNRLGRISVVRAGDGIDPRPIAAGPR